jgi:hypothetical protein
METTWRCDGSQDARTLRAHIPASLVYCTLILSGALCKLKTLSVEVMSIFVWHSVKA